MAKSTAPEAGAGLPYPVHASPFTDEQLALLAAPLDPKLAARMQPDNRSGSKVSFLEAHVVIEQANRILGYGAWGYEVLERGFIPNPYDPDSGAGLHQALVQVTVRGCEPVVELGDCALQVSQGKKANLAQISMASKGAVTDGMKRGLRHFGDQFGNSLYDKDSDIHRMIDQAIAEEARQAQSPRAPEHSRTNQPAPQPVPPSTAPPQAPSNSAPIQDQSSTGEPMSEAALVAHWGQRIEASGDLAALRMALDAVARLVQAGNISSAAAEPLRQARDRKKKELEARAA